MSSRYTPKRILKKQLSQQEHSLMEDWAPGNLNAHHNIETDAPVLAKHQAPSSKLVKQEGYITPNGTHLSDHELAKLSHGIENSESKCMGLPSMKMEFTTRYWFYYAIVSVPA
ncbi:hypothetical protein BDV27DRAFT_145068 [Aspergillus caelatus]|uniref:Uncharacterized protein n=1 Tax=Aspergillus caelatus TaxID=61420 RepID=A0A5N7A4G9_9EURO|nr:uncharacterized protein BDV27DRAFT_145068 [Aspergillus caelatus]KAE8364744.1 hypothetical protein BDV27DRAFT_145068 [Aspergillus caelatus]